MTEVHPPRGIEAILESFGARPEFRDSVIGDLAQEYGERVARFGFRAARLWYYREAARAVPHLLRDWLRGAGLADVRRLLNVAGLAYVMTMTIEIVLFFGAFALGDALLPRGMWAAAGAIRALIVIALAITSPVIAGYLAASLEKERPMIGSAAVACGWAVFIIGGVALTSVLPPPTGLPVDFLLPAAFRLALIPFIAILALIGGALQVRRAVARR